MIFKPISYEYEMPIWLSQTSLKNPQIVIHNLVHQDLTEKNKDNSMSLHDKITGNCSRPYWFCYNYPVYENIKNAAHPAFLTMITHQYLELESRGPLQKSFPSLEFLSQLSSSPTTTLSLVSTALKISCMDSVKFTAYKTVQINYRWRVTAWN